MHKRLLAALMLTFVLNAAPAPAQPAATRAPSVAGRLPAPIATPEFARLTGRLSEPGGYFDTDNLISNESSYLHAMGALDALNVRGGAYIGVGPDQSFSYIARTRAQMAFLVDIRRDNLLQHLLFKTLFETASNRAEYLALWLGRPIPDDPRLWTERSIVDIVALLDSVPSTDRSRSHASEAVRSRLRHVGVALSATDQATIARFHGAFMAAGLSLRFTTAGRAPRPYYPTLRNLLLETDLDGQRASYLASEADFQYVKELQRRNLIIPVVGDLGGESALRAVGDVVRRRGLEVTTLYASNAEDYVMRDGHFERYVQNVMSLPLAARGVIIRSWFGGPGTHTHSAPGYFSTQLVQSFSAFAAAAADSAMWSYRALVSSPHVSP